MSVALCSFARHFMKIMNVLILPLHVVCSSSKSTYHKNVRNFKVFIRCEIVTNAVMLDFIFADNVFFLTLCVFCSLLVKYCNNSGTLQPVLQFPQVSVFHEFVFHSMNFDNRILHNITLTFLCFKIFRETPTVLCSY